jgi:hypothetical protein
LSVEKTEMSFPEISIEKLELAPEQRGHRNGLQAPGCELIMTLHGAALVTAYIGAPADADARERPSCSFRDGADVTEIQAFALERHCQDGTIVLRTARGPTRRQPRAE